MPDPRRVAPGGYSPGLLKTDATPASRAPQSLLPVTLLEPAAICSPPRAGDSRQSRWHRSCCHPSRATSATSATSETRSFAGTTSPATGQGAARARRLLKKDHIALIGEVKPQVRSLLRHRKWAFQHAPRAVPGHQLTGRYFLVGLAPPWRATRAWPPGAGGSHVPGNLPRQLLDGPGRVLLLRRRDGGLDTPLPLLRAERRRGISGKILDSTRDALLGLNFRRRARPVRRVSPAVSQPRRGRGRVRRGAPPP